MLVADLFFCYTHGTTHTPPNEAGVGPGGVICRGEVWPSVVAAEVVQTLNPEPIAEERVFVLTSGDFAYVDTVSDGLVPCRITGIDEDGIATVVVTASRGGWKRGGAYPLMNPRMSLVNRGQVSTRKGQPIVSGLTMIVTDEGVLL